MTLTRIHPVRCLLVAVVFALAFPATAQEYGRIEDIQAQTPGYFYFARPGEAVVAVTAVGAIGAPGRYFVGTGTDLGELVALAGGAGAIGQLATGEEPTVRLYRAGDVAFEGPLRDLYGPGSSAVALRDGDVAEVSARTVAVPGFYVFAAPGQPTVTVTAAGALAAPGRYVLDTGTTVGDLVAFAGGGAESARDPNTEVTQTVELYRDGAVLFTADLTNLYGAESPTLRTGDVVDLDVVVDRGGARFTWRDGLSVLTSVLAVLIAVDRLAN